MQVPSVKVNCHDGAPAAKNLIEPTSCYANRRVDRIVVAVVGKLNILASFLRVTVPYENGSSSTRPLLIMLVSFVIPSTSHHGEPASRSILAYSTF